MAIRECCKSDATGMLRRHAAFIGRIGHDEYFNYADSLWMIAPYGTVYRYDNEIDKAYLLRLLGSQQGARQ